MSFEKFWKELGERIQKIMDKKGITKKKLVEDLDCDERTVRRILKGQCPTSFDKVKKIAEVLDVDFDMLIKVSDKKIKFKSINP